MKTNEPQLSMLPPAWGGPFVWIRNAAGNLELHAVSKLVGDAKAAVEAIAKRVTR